MRKEVIGNRVAISRKEDTVLREVIHTLILLTFYNVYDYSAHSILKDKWRFLAKPRISKREK